MFLTPKLCGADEVKSDLGGHWRSLLRSAFYSLTAGQMWLKFGMESPWYLWFVVASCMGLHRIARDRTESHGSAHGTGWHGMARGHGMAHGIAWHGMARDGTGSSTGCTDTGWQRDGPG